MPGRDTAPGFLLRRLACAGVAGQFGHNEPKLLKRNTERSGDALQVTARSRTAARY